MRPVDALAVLGILCGLYYFALGISAGGHLRDRERARSPGERLLLTNFLWSLSSGEFLEEGRRICRKANWVALVAAVAWISWAILK
jgi:predicted branched-subunit amino acid permease